MSAALAAVAGSFAALYAAHQVADHWIQTDHQALTKGEPGWRGRRACAAHVTTYTLTGIVALAALAAATGWAPDPGHTVAGLAVSAASHYVADRRTPLRRLASATGLAEFYAFGVPRPDSDDRPCLGTGAYALDQSWHHGWLFTTALIIGGAW